MRINRTASRAKNSLKNGITLKNIEAKLEGNAASSDIVLFAKDVAEFGNSKTHHDYEVKISFAEFLKLVEVVGKATGENKLHIQASIGKELGKLIKLVNLCSE